jgi:serine O-acetyltransferase
MHKFHNPEALWQILRQEAQTVASQEPMLASYVHSVILNHKTLAEAISFHLAHLLGSSTTPALLLREVCLDALRSDPGILQNLCCDIVACYERDAACDHYLMPVLYFKGFHALQSYRIAHWLWQQDRRTLALHFQNRMSEVFAVDIHPAAEIGGGILIDHATGVVIGETAIVEDNVSMLHEVTLGGSGTQRGHRRHPLIRQGVLLSAGAKVLGPVEIGEGAKIGGGSVVLTDVPPHSTAAGVPARILGRPAADQPALDMDHKLGDIGDGVDG